MTFPSILLILASASPQQALKVEPVPTGLSRLIQVTFAPGDDASRIFVVRQLGTIHVIQDDVILPTPFLDLSAKLVSGGEQGLLGLAFHPDYEQNGYFYVNYTDSSGGDTVIERYSVDPNDPNRALPASALVILEVDQPGPTHNAGWLSFGPRGYLFIALGDGGDGGHRAQNGAELLGKMLRLDVDNPSGGLNYGIPADNPFVNDPNFRDEIWAYGVRNPWRSDFDAHTGDLWITDVGHFNWEEVNHQPAGVGGVNYGWRIMEGTHCYDPPTNCNQTGLTLPIYEYDHTGSPPRCSIIGGVLYRGRQMADMHARFFFSDYCSRQTWSFRRSGSGITGFTDHTNELLRPNGGTLNLVYSLGEDADGEIYLTTALYTNEIFRVVPRGLRLRMPHMKAGAPASIQITDGAPAAMTGLFYSLGGLGSTSIQQAQVTLGIKNAQLLGTRMTDAAGTANFNGIVPTGLQDRTLWLQVAQLGVTSNIGIDTVD